MLDESPLKIAIEAALHQVDAVHQAYQKYFLGVDRKPPIVKRQQLDRAIMLLRKEAPKLASPTALFQVNSVIAKYATFANRWDKVMKQIEDGTYPGFKKRD